MEKEIMGTAEIDKTGNTKVIENITLHSVSLIRLIKLKTLSRLTDQKIVETISVENAGSHHYKLFKYQKYNQRLRESLYGKCRYHRRQVKIMERTQSTKTC